MIIDLKIDGYSIGKLDMDRSAMATLKFASKPTFLITFLEKNEIIIANHSDRIFNIYLHKTINIELIENNRTV